MTKAFGWFFVLVLGPFMALYQEPGTKDASVPPAATELNVSNTTTAKARYDAALATAAEAFDRAAAKAHADYLANLDLALRAETMAGNLDAALAIREERKSAEKAGPRRIESSTSTPVQPQGKADLPAAKFADKDFVEIQNSAGLLKLNSDFTIEVWCRWNERQPYASLAADELWPKMSPQSLAVDHDCGWILRREAREIKPVLQFTVGTSMGEWLFLNAALPKRRPAAGLSPWQHVAVCRSADSLGMFLNGKLVATDSISGIELVASPTPLYVGTRRDAHGNSRFDGLMRAFRVSQTCRYEKGFEPATFWAADEETLVLYNFSLDDDGMVVDHSGLEHHGVVSGVELVRQSQ